MGIPMNTLCVKCLLNKHIDNARSLGTEEQANAFVGDIFRLFSNQQEWNSSMMGMHINELYVRHNRINVTGTNLKSHSELFAGMFDASGLLDTARP